MTDTQSDYDFQAIVDRFTDLAEEQIGDNLISLVLYGSVARGDAGPESDIDILIVLSEGSNSYYERLQPVLPILEKTTKEFIRVTGDAIDLPPEISTLVLTREEASKHRHIFLDMIEDARIMFDRDDFFKERLKALSSRLEELGSKKIRINGSWYWDLKPDLKPGEVVAL